MLRYKLLLWIFGLLLGQVVYASTINVREYYVPYLDGKQIHIKEKKLADNKPHQVLVLLNPLSIPSLEAFDVPGYSLMDTLAKAGWDVWGIDFIGQGKSSYPSEMQKNPAPAGKFPLRAKDATLQLDYIIPFILHQANKKTLSMLGWSWGSIVAAMYAINHPKQVDHLVLYGAIYDSSLPASVEAQFVLPYASANHQFNKHLPAYQNISWQMIENHWKKMIAGNKNITSPQVFNVVGKAYCQIDPHPFIKNTLRRSMGPMEDLFLAWNGYPLYAIHALTIPTLVIYGEHDFFADKRLYSQLTHVKIKKEIILENATHWVIYEKNRKVFSDAVLNFLNKSSEESK